MADGMPYDGFSRVRAAQQARSRRAQQQALDAFDALLRERSYASVTMQDVADRAGLSVTSIYARFDGKDALVLALHEVVMAAGLEAMAALAQAQRERPSSVEDFARTLIEGAIASTAEQAHVIRAVLASEDDETQERAAQFVILGSETIASALAPTGSGSEAFDRGVDFAWRAVVAMVQQSLALHGRALGRFELTTEEFVDRLVSVFLSCLGQAHASKRVRGEAH